MANEPRGLGGWMFIPIFGLFTTPIKTAMLLFQVHIPIFRDGYWETITDPSSEYYHVLLGPLIISEIAVNIGFIISSLYLLYLLFSKHRLFPKFFIIYMIANVVFVICDSYLASIMPMNAEQQGKWLSSDSIRTVIGAIIWIPYFIYSKRVENTFIEPMLDNQLDHYDDNNDEHNDQDREGSAPS